MGWVFVNIILPVAVPMLFMLLAETLVSLPQAAAKRGRILLLVKDGQLGWVALGFSASCSYDAFMYLNRPDVAAPPFGSAAICRAAFCNTRLN